MEKPTSKLRFISSPQTDGDPNLFDSKQNVNPAKTHTLIVPKYFPMFFICQHSESTLQLQNTWLSLY